MTKNLQKPDLPPGAVVEVLGDGRAIRNDGGELKPASENAWYVLATVYGEQTGELVDTRLDAKNRRIWNGWACAGLNDETLAILVERLGLPLEELRPLEAEEQKDLRNAFDRRLGADAAIPDRSELIDMSQIHFSRAVSWQKRFFHWEISFSKSAFGKEANFFEAKFARAANFDHTFFGSDATFFAAFFGGIASFKFSNFELGPSFSTATFDSSVYYDRTVFRQSASFGGAVFRKDARFNSAKLVGRAVFNSADFNGSVLFNGATFGGVAEFSFAAFRGPSSFVSAEFAEDADLSSVSFGMNVTFYSATFNNRVSLKSVTCIGEASFDFAIFGGPSSFIESRFSDQVTFRDCRFDTPANFRKTYFLKRLPVFEGTILHETTYFTAGDGFWPVEPENAPEEGKEAAATIRHVVGRQSRTDDEHFFFRKEMRFAEQIGGSQGVLVRFYRGFSDYGNSVFRPSAILGGTIVVGWLILLFPFAWESVIHQADRSGWQAFGLSFSNTFAFLGFNRLYYGPEYLSGLATWVKVVGALQTIIGFIFLFFLGLGLRNRFRLK